MKTIRTMGFLALVAAALLIAPGTATATLGSNTGGDASFFDNYLNPNAKGTRFTGTMEISWIPLGINVTCKDSPIDVAGYDVHFVLRVDDKKIVVPLSGVAQDVCISDVEFVVESINGFVNAAVVPALGLTGGATLRSVSNVADPQDTSQLIWLMLDFEYAVQ